MAQDFSTLENMSVDELLDELERHGVNATEIRKQYRMQGFIDREMFNNLCKLYISHIRHKAYREFSQ